jgi:hypothetical protein
MKNSCASCCSNPAMSPLYLLPRSLSDTPTATEHPSPPDTQRKGQRRTVQCTRRRAAGGTGSWARRRPHRTARRKYQQAHSCTQAREQRIPESPSTTKNRASR